MDGSRLDTCPERSRRKRVLILLRIGAVLAMVAISALILLNAPRLRELGRYGYVGIFLLSFAANATIILPAPGWLIPIAAGSAFHPLLVGLIAGAGQALGELTGYFAGASGRFVLEERERYERLSALMQKYGAWLLIALGLIPNPLFDLAGITAGALRFPIHIFLAATFVGKFLRATLFAYGGYSIFIRWLGV